MLITAILRAFTQWRKYRRTMLALRPLGSNHLADLGLDQRTLRAHAWKVARA